MEEQHYYLGLQVAELDTAYSDYSGRLIHTEFGLGETARDLDFLQDYASSIHYGLVEMGGFRRYNELSVEQNRHMYRQSKPTSHHFTGWVVIDICVWWPNIPLASMEQQIQQIKQLLINHGKKKEKSLEMEVDPPVEDVSSRGHILQR